MHALFSETFIDKARFQLSNVISKFWVVFMQTKAVFVGFSSEGMTILMHYLRIEEYTNSQELL
jgi:hypothetical protein